MGDLFEPDNVILDKIAHRLRENLKQYPCIFENPKTDRFYATTLVLTQHETRLLLKLLEK